MSEARKGLKISEEGRRKLSEARKRDYENGKRGVPQRKGIVTSEETKEKMRKPKQNVENYKGPKERHTCPHCGKEGGGGVMYRFHFDNCKLKQLG